MDIVRIILGIILLIVGLLGALVPIIPGPFFAFASLLILQLSGPVFTTQFLLIIGLVSIVITILDYFIPILGTKRLGGSKWGKRGSTIGLIIATIILPFLGIAIGPFGLLGIIIFPFLGAYIGETLHRNTQKKAIKSALGSFIGFVSGTLLKLIYGGIIAFYFIKETIVIIKNML